MTADFVVRVKLFAIYQDVIGQPELVWPITPDTTVGELFQAILDEYPRLKAWQSQTQFGVNLAFVEADTVLHPEDEVVLIPPVSGG